MKHYKRILQLGILLLLIVLTACNKPTAEETATPVDPVAIFTQAAQTVAAQVTQTAQAIPPTSTPQPTATSAPSATPTLAATLAIGATQNLLTPLPTVTPFSMGAQPTQSGPLCDDAVFVADITVPDGTKMQPGEDFTKIWRIKNTGICTWDEGYRLVFAYGDPLDGPGWTIKKKKDFVPPGGTIDIGIPMTAHLAPGEYVGCWIMQNDRGVNFGGVVCVDIVVVEP